MAFLTQDGKLTDIGSWYLGRNETGNVPSHAPGISNYFAGSGLPLAIAILWTIMWLSGDNCV